MVDCVKVFHLIRGDGGVLVFAGTFGHYIDPVISPADVGRISRLAQYRHGEAVDSMTISTPASFHINLAGSFSANTFVRGHGSSFAV
jgi:hypothetical protein